MKYQHIVLGGSGHVGASLATELINLGSSVLIIGHDANKKDEWKNKGADYEVIDILDSGELQRVFKQGERLFILNPPAPPSTDTVAVETKQVNSIIHALTGVQFDKIVVASTYGAQPGDKIGDLGVLYELEQVLISKNIPLAIIRSAYYMSNWAMVLDSLKTDGILPTMYPEDFKLPMVAPEDIGKFASKLMTNYTTRIHYIEGPDRYSPNEVAVAFSTALNKLVKVSSIPESQWFESLKKTGFSDKAAESMVNMTQSAMSDKYKIPEPVKGETTLTAYINRLVQ